jgi:hypothetical protein
MIPGNGFKEQRKKGEASLALMLKTLEIFQ